jgi:signal transduction histidine kinase
VSAQVPEQGPRAGYQALTRVAQHVWVVVAFILVWRYFTYVRPNLRHPDWQLNAFYFVAVAGTAFRYLTGVRHGDARWHRLLFDGLSIFAIALGVGLTGGIKSDLWLVYFIFLIAETVAASGRTYLITDTLAVLSYVAATWPRQPDQGYAEILLTRIFFLMVVASIARTLAAEERARQQDLAGLREALSVSEERRRLARDLHDGLGHVLTRVILSLEVARRQCATDPPAAAAAVGDQATALRGAMEEMRQIVATLRTDAGDTRLLTALRDLAARLGESDQLRVHLDLPGGDLPLSAQRQYHLLRVIQEALTNCLRHADSGEAWVRVSLHEQPVGPARVVVVVEDRGRGFDPERAGAAGGHGLAGMAERLTPYEGAVTIHSAPGQGTRVTAEVPADLEAS